MTHEPYIRLKSDESETRFEWSGFDGDDCFSDFRIIVTTAGQSRQFEFGACALHGLRKLIKVFSDPNQGAAELGFRHPDIRWCDVHRLGNEDYRLIVRYEGSGLHEEFRFHRPEVHIHQDNDE
jgi:hypothetical protein